MTRFAESRRRIYCCVKKMQIFFRKKVTKTCFFQVMDAEKQKAESGADHHEKTLAFHAAESKVSFLHDSLTRDRY